MAGWRQREAVEVVAHSNSCSAVNARIDGIVRSSSSANFGGELDQGGSSDMRILLVWVHGECRRLGPAKCAKQLTKQHRRLHATQRRTSRT